MSKTISMTIYCANKKGGRYKATFEEKNLGEWYGISSEPLKPLSFFERRSLKSQVLPSKSDGFSSIAGVKSKQQQASIVKGAFTLAH